MVRWRVNSKQFAYRKKGYRTWKDIEKEKVKPEYWTAFSENSKSRPAWQAETRLLEGDSMKDKRGRELTPITCAECGKADSVPFVPDPAKPAPLCRLCHRERRIAERRMELSELKVTKPAEPEKLGTIDGKRPDKGGYVTSRVYSSEGIAPTVTENGGALIREPSIRSRVS